MKIRNKILLSFSATTILLMAVAFLFIYWLFAEYREEEFQQKQHVKIKSTIKLINRFKKESREISSFLDAQDIHDFYDEKLLIFDGDKQLIFSSLDNLGIHKRNKILNELSPSHRWIETKEGRYDLIGVYIENNNKSYYAISKAFDSFGYDKLHFLKNALVFIFIAIVIIVLFISFYLSNNLSKPINNLAILLSRYNLNDPENEPLKNKTSTQELQYLTHRFNELLNRTREAFDFQKNTVNLISHQLKTPVAVLVSELEKMQQISNPSQYQEELAVQIQRAKSLGDIISTLLEISKIESSNLPINEPLRMDELIFDLIERKNELNNHHSFIVNFIPETFTEKQMEITGNELLLKQAFQNLISNSIAYNEHLTSKITFVTEAKALKIIISNTGPALLKDEEKMLFNYFFRGRNSAGKPGSGLGLVLTRKIIEHHHGQIKYYHSEGENHFEITFKQ